MKLYALALFAAVASAQPLLHAAETPNVIVIIADDLGFGDISCNGSSLVPTPNIDKLASEGIRFTSGYCPASTCTPSRFSLMTGTYAFRVPGTGVAAPNAAALLRPERPTLPGMLQKAGYHTAAIGKWHLGLGDAKPDWNGELKPGPLDVGFHHCLLLPTTNDRVPQVLVEDRKVRGLDPQDPLWVGDEKPSADHVTGISHRGTLKLDWDYGHNGTIHNGISRIGFYTGGAKARFRDEDLADIWIKDANQWLEAHQAGPFFLYLAAHDIHVPRVPHERFQGKSLTGPRGDCILEFDWTVGEVLKTLDRLKLAEKTLVLLCSDNGPVLNDGYKDEAVEKLAAHKPGGPFRDGKYSVYEGGTRTPFITRWKGRIQPGISDEIVSLVDLYASLAALTGQKVAPTAALDSQNVLGALLGEKGAKGREVLLQQDNAGQKMGLRVGNWKLVKGAPKRPNALELYDLAKDPGETTDLAQENPVQLEKLRLLLEKITNR
jgi:arylsulfatase A-like enzyme